MLKAKDVIKYILTVTLICLFIFFTLYYYNKVLREKLEANTWASLGEILQQQASTFNAQFTAEKTELFVIASLFPKFNSIDDISLETLQRLVENTPFEYITVVNTEYENINNKGEKVDLSSREYIYQAFLGEMAISNPLHSKYRDSTIIAIATPIFRDSNIQGVLVGSFDVNELDKLFFASYENSGYAYIVDTQGNIIARTTNSYTITTGHNLFDTYKKANFDKNYDSFQDIYKKITEGYSGSIQYEVDGQKRLGRYKKLGINDWYIFSIVPHDIINQQGSEILFDSAVLTLVIVLFAIIIVYLIYVIQKRHLRRISEIAYVDILTGLPTLAKFKLEAQNLLNDYPTESFCIIKLDIENFKLINQIVGYAEGDQILRTVGKALTSLVTEEKSIVAHSNVDEFIVICPYIDNENLVIKRKEFLINFNNLMGDDFSYPMVFPTGQYVVDRNEEQEANILDILEKVNFAHKYAKHNKQEICVYNDDLTKEAFRQKEIEKKMEQALNTDEFKVYLQPKYYITDESIGGAEALIRWHHDNTHITFPGAFIPLFESNGFITRVDMYIFRKVCVLIASWIEKSIEPVCISVNFSRLHLTNPLFVQTLCDIADECKVPRHFLEIELTETIIFDHEDVLLDVLLEIHEAGFTLSMDDFGTGYSSLGLLKNLPIDVIKIDKTFFTSTQNYDREKIVLAKVLEMAKDLKIHTVAEGVETKNHIDLLRELGCDLVQGYYYAKPMPAEKFTALLKQRQQ